MRSTIVSVMVLLCLGALPAFAQDLGPAQDTIALVITKSPSALAGQDTLELELWVYNDDLVKGANVGFEWFNTNFDMVNAESTPLVQNGFDLAIGLYENSDLATTNANDRFLFAGARLFNGVTAGTERRLWATYTLVANSWTVNDSIALDTITYSNGTIYVFVNANTKGYEPVWTGGDQPIVIFDPDRPAASNLVVSPTEINITAEAGTGVQPVEQFEVTSDGDPLSVNVSESETWLSLSPASGTTPQTFDATVDVTGLAAGDYSTDIVIISPDADNSPQTVTVNLTVTPAAPEIAVDQVSLAFAAVAGGADPAPLTINVTNAGDGTLDPTVSTATAWLSVDPTSGIAPFAITVSASVGGLTPGTYEDTVTISDPDATNDPVKVPVTFQVFAPPVIVVDPTSFSLSAIEGEVLPTETLEITNGGGSTLSVTLGTSEAWLTVSPTSGDAPLSVSVDVSAVGLAPGIHEDSILIVDPNASNSPLAVLVSLEVIANQPPVLRPVNDTTVDECDTLTVSFSATDADGDDVDFWVEPLATNMTVTQMAGNMAQLRFEPSFDQAGTYVQTVFASDGKDTVSQEFTITIEDCDPGFDAIAEISPERMSVILNNAIDPFIGTVLLGNITDGVHTVEDIDPSTLVIDGSIVPIGTTVLDSAPGFTGKVLEIEWYVREFINPRLPFFDSSAISISIEGSFTDAETFATADQIRLIGKLTGDMNGNGELDMVDLAWFIDYLFVGGEPPADMRMADFDFSGEVDPLDLTRMVDYFFYQ